MGDTFTITYAFTLPDRRKLGFKMLFDDKRIELIRRSNSEPPAWTVLDFEQCPHCPLTPETHPHCPVALNLVPVIERFDRLMSFEKVIVEVITAERRVLQKTSAQEGISSLMGLLIAGSSCPYTHFFKPMARFHLPFASKDETIWRAVSTFLLSRYFSNAGFQGTESHLRELFRIYNDVAILNDAVVSRLRSATLKDSAVNALVHLDVFAKFLTPPLEDSLKHIRPVFGPFLTESPTSPKKRRPKNE
jgi:hypothetical protein